MDGELLPDHKFCYPVSSSTYEYHTVPFWPADRRSILFVNDRCGHNGTETRQPSPLTLPTSEIAAGADSFSQDIDADSFAQEIATDSFESADNCIPRSRKWTRERSSGAVEEESQWRRFEIEVAELLEIKQIGTSHLRFSLHSSCDARQAAQRPRQEGIQCSVDWLLVLRCSESQVGVGGENSSDEGGSGGLVNNIVKGPWSREEDALLAKLFASLLLGSDYGSRWFEDHSRHVVNKFHEEQTAKEAIAAEEEGEGEKEDEGQAGQMSKGRPANEKSLPLSEFTFGCLGKKHIKLPADCLSMALGLVDDAINASALLVMLMVSSKITGNLGLLCFREAEGITLTGSCEVWGLLFI
ncbi:unnamed protein product [Linum tenue]|uniref:Myb-like domain-containing protein n=1 Tax=Linum tenue TaxID=586396 RepID=A0AAV0H1F0_9ROSI|nr:unnamed protein product [Linum tenue]